MASAAVVNCTSGAVKRRLVIQAATRPNARVSAAIRAIFHMKLSTGAMMPLMGKSIAMNQGVPRIALAAARYRVLPGPRI